MGRYGITARQRDLYNFVATYLSATGGVAPSLEECAQALGLVRSGVHRMLGCLEERGLIRRLAGRTRAIEVLVPMPRFTAPDGSGLIFIPIPAGRSPRGSGLAVSPSASPTLSRAPLPSAAA